MSSNKNCLITLNPDMHQVSVSYFNLQNLLITPPVPYIMYLN